MGLLEKLFGFNIDSNAIIVNLIVFPTPIKVQKHSPNGNNMTSLPLISNRNMKFTFPAENVRHRNLLYDKIPFMWALIKGQGWL